MRQYLTRRLMQSAVVLFVVSFITFIIPAMFHGTVARVVLGPRATKADILEFNHAHFFDRSIFYQYYRYVNGLFHGDFGHSVLRKTMNKPAWEILSPALPRTIWLAIVPLFLALLIAIPLGVTQAWRRNKAFDYITTFISFVLYSTPAYLMSILAVSVFAINLGIFPGLIPYPTGSGFFDPPLFMIQNWSAFVLPIGSLTLLSLAGVARFTRGAVLDSIVQDYVRTARAKGAGNWRVLSRHVLRNALIPLVTILGLSLPGLFAGALVTEQVFNYPGMGFITVSHTVGRDIPVVMAATLIIAIATVIGNLIADLALVVVDPRIRISSK
ncbi:MAG: ABC transporter permease [Actinomycetes bacterium]